MLELKQFPERLKRALIRAARVMRLKRSTAYVLMELVDNPNSRAWSNDTMAHATGFHVRTIELALAELRLHGFISMQYRRNMTAIKHLCVEAILRAVEHGVEVAKKARAAAKSLGLRALSRIRNPKRRISKKVILEALDRVSRIASTEKSDATPSLLRSMGLLTGEMRRKP